MRSSDLICLESSKINKKLLAALAKRQSVTKRNEYQAKLQAQVGASFNALGCGMSDLSRLFRERILKEKIKTAIRKLAEGIQLLADLQYHLSLNRQAFIKPCLMFVGKSAADGILVEDWLFDAEVFSFCRSLQISSGLRKGGTQVFSKLPTTATLAEKSAFQPVRQSNVQQAPIRRAENAGVNGCV